jgi:hypothetical protein
VLNNPINGIDLQPLPFVVRRVWQRLEPSLTQACAAAQRKR